MASWRLTTTRVVREASVCVDAGEHACDVREPG
jgi:hypothetical protein